MNNNGKPKITAIVRFDHSAVAIGRKFGRHEFVSFDALKKYAEGGGYEISIAHAHPAGLPAQSLMQEGTQTRKEEDEGKRVPVLRNICAGKR